MVVWQLGLISFFMFFVVHLVTAKILRQPAHTLIGPPLMTGLMSMVLLDMGWVFLPTALLGHFSACLIRVGGITSMWKGTRLVFGFVDDNSRLKSSFVASLRGVKGFTIGKGYREDTESYPKLVIRGFHVGATKCGAPIAVGLGKWKEADYL